MKWILAAIEIACFAFIAHESTWQVLAVAIVLALANYVGGRLEGKL